MATITVTRGYNNPTGFNSGETVTPSKLNLLGTPSVAISNIVNGDIDANAGISLTKLATGALPSGITVASANIVDGTIATGDLANNAVDSTKLRDSAALSVIGNATNAAADPADIAAATDGHVLRRSGTALGFGTVASAGIADAAVTAAKLSGAQSGNAPVFGVRAWVNFNGQRNAADTAASSDGQNVLIRSSGNVSSVLKHDKGDYTINFTTALPDTNYAVIGTGTEKQGAQPNVVCVALSSGTAYSSKTTSSVRVNCNDTDVAGLNESFDINVMILR